MKLNFILGLPRTGSTLLCNTLAQNPRFRVSNTSVLPGVLEAVTTIYSHSPEIKGMLSADRERTEAMLRRVLLSICREWYDNDDRMVFDKSRGWITQIVLMQTLFPDSKFIVMVNDLRAIVASIEKQDRKTAIFKLGQATMLEERLGRMLDPKKGMIGAPLTGLKDMSNRKLEAYFLKVSDFTANPKLAMKELYEYLEVPYFKKHDYLNVVNVSQEPDHFYLNKYPHVGAGKIEHRQPYWEEYLSAGLCNRIVQQYQWFYEAFYPEVLASNVDPT